MEQTKEPAAETLKAASAYETIANEIEAAKAAAGDAGAAADTLASMVKSFYNFLDSVSVINFEILVELDMKKLYFFMIRRLASKIRQTNPRIEQTNYWKIRKEQRLNSMMSLNPN